MWGGPPLQTTHARGQYTLSLDALSRSTRTASGSTHSLSVLLWSKHIPSTRTVRTVSRPLVRGLRRGLAPPSLRLVRVRPRRGALAPLPGCAGTADGETGGLVLALAALAHQKTTSTDKKCDYAMHVDSALLTLEPSPWFAQGEPPH